MTTRTMKTLVLEDGGTIVYRKTAAPRKRLKKRAKEVIVLIHGLTSSISAWESYERHFAKHYDTLAIDLRGHGMSFRPQHPEEYAISKFSEDIYRILRHEKVHNCVIVGHSFGTLIVLDFLRHHQGIVSKAVLVSAECAPSREKRARRIAPVLWASNVANLFPTLKREGGHVDYRPFVGTGDWNLHRLYTDIMNTGLKSYANAMRQAYAYDATATLPKIRVPVLLVHGEDDSIFPLAAAQRMARALPRAELVVLPHTDHIIVLNKTDQLITAIDRFLRRSS